jgi:predicted GNAT family acetyltransferase
LLEINIVAVDGDWRGKGIATALLHRTRSVHLVDLSS